MCHLKRKKDAKVTAKNATKETENRRKSMKMFMCHLKRRENAKVTPKIQQKKQKRRGRA